MRARHLLGQLTATLALILVLATTSYANGVRGASGYGVNGSSCFSTITSDPTSNCEGFTQGIFTIGSNTYNGDRFVFVEPNGTGSGVLDILQINADSSLTLNVTSLASTGVFACGTFGSSSSGAVDSIGTSLTGLYCTTGASDSSGATEPGYYDPSQTISGITESTSGSQVTFANTTGSPAAVFVTDGDIVGATFTAGGSVVPTPEPGSLTLLGVGLLALGGAVRRRTLGTP
jgi:hypothetical protein